MADLARVLAEVVGRELPPYFKIESPGNFPDFEKICADLGDKILSPTWRKTVLVGGKLFEEIREKNPKNTDVQFLLSVIRQYKTALTGGVSKVSEAKGIAGKGD